MPLDSCYEESYTIFVEPIRVPSPYARTFSLDKANHFQSKSLLSAFGYGLCAGFVGITAMNISQTIEQQFTGRPAFRVPGENITRFFRQCFNFAKNNPHVNHSSYRKESSSGAEPEPVAPHSDAMTKWGVYLGQGALLGGLRGVMSYYGCRGTVSDLVFMGLTFPGDGCSAWRELTENTPLAQIVLNSLPNIAHQTVYAFVTGFLCDHWVS
ncbi:hypothetical protein Agabi119p4_3728 [Agaricus bisporus var. burnettii]|uniref:Uncharacterized protein n=1 Tax=Agaricus bisporus var. burnettii TaxID=192524 RepID=A0A8H7F5B4_AGABI|nr:hypothetical protein Agabi119p4_3728 [Agaricus bisporus var. burnettii]